MSKGDELPRERHGPPVTTTIDLNAPLGTEGEDDAPRRPRLPPLSPSRASPHSTTSSLLIGRGSERPERDILAKPLYSPSTTPGYLSTSAPLSDRYISRYAQDAIAPTSRDAPRHSPPFRPEHREREVLDPYEARQNPSSTSLTSALPSSRTGPNYPNILPAPSGIAEYRARPHSPRSRFDLPREPTRQRYDALPSESFPPLRSKLSPSPTHPASTSRNITSIISGEANSPQDLLTARHLPSIPPPIPPGRPSSEYRPGSPRSSTLPYSHRTLPPVSVLHTVPSLPSIVDHPDRRGASEGFETPFHRDSFSTGSSSGPSRVRSPPRSRAALEPGRRMSSQPPHHGDREPFFNSEVYLTLAHVSPPLDFGSWSEARIGAYRAGYEDAMRAVEGGIVGVGGSNFPRPRLLRHGDHTGAPAERTHFPSPAFSDPHPRSRRHEYPGRRPSPPIRGPSYPPHRSPRLRNPRDVRDPRDSYSNQPWTSERTSPQTRAYYERSSIHDRDRYAPYPRSGGGGGAYQVEGGYYYGGSSKPSRQLISCYPCRTRKLKCDGEKPCGQCVRRNGEKDCKYADRVRRRGKGKRATEGGSSGASEERDEPPSEGERKMESQSRGLQLELQGDQSRGTEDTGRSTGESPLARREDREESMDAEQEQEREHPRDHPIA